MSTQAQTAYLARHLPPRSRSGHVALVTGGTRGIGKEAARALVRAGVTVVVAAREPETGERSAAELSADAREGARAVYHRLELDDPASIPETAAFVAKEFGRLDILVNNAAKAFTPRPAFAVTAAQMREVYEVNVFAVVAMVQAFLPLLERSEAGRIVNVSSERGSLGVGEGKVADEMRAWAKTDARPGTMAHRIAFVTQPNMAYSTSKAALNAITQHFAYEFEKAGSRVKINAAAPGHCATAFNGFRGYRKPEDGARIIAALALVGDEGPNGGFFNDEGPTTL
jgi:NAD(P)-dependent dehydrogenase (short-subunit alcohol dehydrogenase family)